MKDKYYFNGFLNAKTSFKISAVLFVLLGLSMGAAAFQPELSDKTGSDIELPEEKDIQPPEQDSEGVQHGYSGNIDDLDVDFYVDIADQHRDNRTSEESTADNESTSSEGSDSNVGSSGSSSGSSSSGSRHTYENSETEAEQFGFSAQLDRSQNNATVTVNVTEPVNLTFMRDGDEMAQERIDGEYSYPFELGNETEEISVVSNETELASFTVEPLSEEPRPQNDTTDSMPEGNFSLSENQTEPGNRATGEFSSGFPDFISETFERLNNRMDKLLGKFETGFEGI